MARICHGLFRSLNHLRLWMGHTVLGQQTTVRRRSHFLTTQPLANKMCVAFPHLLCPSYYVSQHQAWTSSISIVPQTMISPRQTVPPRITIVLHVTVTLLGCGMKLSSVSCTHQVANIRHGCQHCPYFEHISMSTQDIPNQNHLYPSHIDLPMSHVAWTHLMCPVHFGYPTLEVPTWIICGLKF